MPAPLESDLLRSFLAVCETGSLTAAAGRVGRTQSALSMQIKRLEEVVGTPLFERQPRGVVPTAAGRQLSGYARRVVDLLEVAGAALRTADCAGPVRIGVPVEFSDTAFGSSGAETSSPTKIWRAGASNALAHPSSNANR